MARSVSVSQLPCPRCGATVRADASHCGSCGTPQTKDDPPESWVGRTVDGKYRVERILGVGGMGMVFAARRVLVGDEVALKVLFPRFLESPLQRRLFRDEAVAAARLSHPNVVTVFDADYEAQPEAGRPAVAYIAMELLRGRTLKALLKERSPMPAGEVVRLAEEICDGLAAAHDAGVVHRDLKPDTIFLEAVPGRGPGARERVKLVDFGIAAMLDVDPRDEQRKLLGTLRYMAPEQAAGAPVGPTADLYALGVILYEALTRRRATGKSVSAVLQDAVQPPNVWLPGDRQLPRSLEQLVLALLEKDPSARPQTALAVKDRLFAGAPRLDAEPTVVAPPEPPPRAEGDRTLLRALLGAIAVGVLGGVLYAIFGG